MKLLLAFLLSSMVVSAFGEDELSRAFTKREAKDCIRLLSIIRKKTRATAGLTDKIAKVEIGTAKTEAFALLYLKLNDESICSEQPLKTKHNIVYIQYTCRDKSGKVTLEKSIDAGHSDCQGDTPK